MAQFPSAFTGGLDAWAITVDERLKYDQQFHSLPPSAAGLITGDQARNFFLQSGLPPTVLAQIWALADMNNDGKMDVHEFSIAMKLIKLKLQGHALPPTIPPSMKQPPIGLSAGPPYGIPAVASLATLPTLGMSPPLVSNVPPIANGTPPIIQPLVGFTPAAKTSSVCRPSGKLQKGQSFDAASVSTALPDWAVPQPSRLKYRQLFNSHDKMMSGHLTGAQARTILMQSSLPQAQLASIWNLSDIDQDGKLTAEEFILAMHLIDMAMSGLPLPPVLPADLVPPSFRRGHSGSGVSVTSLHQPEHGAPEEPEEDEQSADKKLPVTFEDKKRENFERGNLELEKRRQVLLEQQRREQERLAALERQEQERRERERLEQERRRQQELEKQLEKQRELERQREEERRREIERREAAKRELERQRQVEWEQTRRQELLAQRNREQEAMVLLKAHKKNLELELEVLNDKKHQLEGKLQDVRFRLSTQRYEIQTTNKSRELRIAEITHLQQQLQESQQWLTRLIPEKQILSEQLNQGQQNSEHRDSLSNLRKALEMKELTRQQLQDQLNIVEKETRAKLLEIDAFNNQLTALELFYFSGTACIEGLSVKLLPEKHLQELRDAPSKRQRQEDEELQRPKHQVSVQTQESSRSQLQEITSEGTRSRGQQLWMKRVAEEEDEEKLSHMLKSQPEVEKTPSQAPWPAERSAVCGVGQDQVAVVYYRALYPFEARSHDEISIHPGDIVMVDESQTGEPGWLGGELNGRTGWFPANYAEKIPDSDVPAIMSSSAGFGSVSKVPIHTTLANTCALARQAPALRAPPAPAPALTHAPGETFIAPPPTVPAAPPVASSSSSSSSSSNWADFSTTWPSNKSEKPEGEGWDAWPCQPTLSVPSAGQIRQRSAFTPATLTGSSPSPVLGQGEKVEGLHAQALYPWRAKKDNHLNFNKNDVITVLEQQDMWWFGDVQGQRGWFPKSYVKLVSAPVRQSLSVESSSSESPPSVKRSSHSPSRPSESGGEYVAMYTYDSSEQGDLTFQQGDMILVTRKEGDWWTGVCADRMGVFPSNYVKPRGTEVVCVADKTGSLGRKPEIAQVMAAYTATGTEQLTLAPGQLILIRKKNAGGWWEGELQARGKKRQIGWFPANYVKLLSPSTSKTVPPPEPSAAKPQPLNTVCQVIGMYDYTAQNHDELPFTKGQLINVISTDDPDWWKGEVDGAVGLFPSNYVKLSSDSDLSQQ